MDLYRLEVIYVPDEMTEPAQQLDALLLEYVEAMAAVVSCNQKIDAAVAKAKKDTLEEVGETISKSLKDADRLRLQIFDIATKNRASLADGKNYIALNNGTLKWHTTKAWKIDVSDARLLELIRRLRAVRFVVDVERTVSKQKLNQNPWIYKLLEKLKAAHRQQTTTFAIVPVGFKGDLKDDPNKIVASSEIVHEE